jgi:hypothetical protein
VAFQDIDRSFLPREEVLIMTDKLVKSGHHCFLIKELDGTTCVRQETGLAAAVIKYPTCIKLSLFALNHVLYTNSYITVYEYCMK